MKHTIPLFAPVLFILLCLAACRTSGSGYNSCAIGADTTLRRQLAGCIDSVDGLVGIAIVTADDSLTVNNDVRYPMMSVFKLHQALAVCDACHLDSLIDISVDEIDPSTWSPMLGGRDADFSIAVADLLAYAIVHSDNNASNLLFGHIVSPARTDCFIRSVADDTTFAVRYTEAQMKADHSLSYSNWTTPLSAATLIRQVFVDSLFVNSRYDAVRQCLAEVTTGSDRLGAPFVGRDDVLFAHKTGSGYRDSSGRLIAFNDVAYIRLANGTDYALAVMIRDFAGSETAAANLMSRISAIVYDRIVENYLK